MVHLEYRVHGHGIRLFERIVVYIYKYYKECLRDEHLLACYAGIFRIVGRSPFSHIVLVVVLLLLVVLVLVVTVVAVT